MKKWIYSSLIITSLFFTSCANVKEAQQEPTTEKTEQSLQRSSTIPVREYSVQSVMWQQNAGEYRALCYQAFNLATYKLDEYLSALDENGKKPAIITDIDETVMDNSPYNAKLIQKGVEYTPEEWYSWTRLAKADAVPGAVEFLQYAKSKGVEIFYVTNRHISEEESTLKNMEVLNFPYADKDHLFLMNETSSKDERFNKVRSEYEVLLYLGDNLGDFSADFRVPNTEKRNKLVDSQRNEFGNRFIVLPNPMYGDWETRGIYEGRKGLSDKEKFRLRKKSLRPY